MGIEITVAETIIDTGVTLGTTVVTLDYPGPQGAQGNSGVVGVTSPITNTGTAGSANIGLNQSLLSLTREQIIGTAITTAAGKALTAGTADYATLAGTATYATLAGTATYATTSGTAIGLSGTITATQVTGTAVTLADTGTVTNTMLADLSVTGSKIGLQAVTATKLAIGAVSNSNVSSVANIAASKIAGTAVTQADTGTVTNTMLAGSIDPSKVTGTAAILGANTFTGKQTLPASTLSAASLRLVDGTAPTTPATGDIWAASGSLIYQSSLGAQTLAFLSSNITGTSSGITGSITASQVTGTAAVLNVANVFTVGGQVVKTGADGTAGAAIWRNSATQTAALFTIYQSNGSTKLAEFDAKGALALTPDSGTTLTVNGSSTSAVQMIVKGAVSQTGDLQQWQNSSATVQAKMSSAGKLTATIDGGSA